MTTITHCGLKTTITSDNNLLSLTLSNAPKYGEFEDELKAIHAKLEKVLRKEIVFSKRGGFNPGYHIKIAGDMWSRDSEKEFKDE